MDHDRKLQAKIVEVLNRHSEFDAGVTGAIGDRNGPWTEITVLSGHWKGKKGEIGIEMKDGVKYYYIVWHDDPDGYWTIKPEDFSTWIDGEFSFTNHSI